MARWRTTTRGAALLVGAAVLAAACTASRPAPGGPEPVPSSLGAVATQAGQTRPVGPVGTGEVAGAAAVLARATTLATEARSGAFTGTIRDHGEQAQVTFAGTRDGSSVDVTKATPKTGTVHLISVGGSVFVKADDTFWSSQRVPFIVSIAGDRFVKVPAGVVPVLDELTLSSFVGRSITTFPADDLSDTVGEETVGQVPCWVLTTSSGDPGDGALYVSKQTSEVVRWVGTKQQPGRLDFSRWNDDLGIAAPSGDEVFAVG